MLYSTFLFTACIFIVQNTQAIEYDPNQIIIKYKSAPNVNLNSSTFNSRSTVNRYITKKINDTSPNLYLLEGDNISERLEEFNANPNIIATGIPDMGLFSTCNPCAANNSFPA